MVFNLCLHNDGPKQTKSLVINLPALVSVPQIMAMY